MQENDYDNLWVLGLVRQVVKGCFQKPNYVYKNYAANTVINRLEFATKNNKLLEMYCDVVDVDSTKLRKKIIDKNIKYLYDIKYKKVKHIQLVEEWKTKKWIIE